MERLDKEGALLEEVSVAEEGVGELDMVRLEDASGGRDEADVRLGTAYLLLESLR